MAADACGKPIKENYFDIIYAGHVIEHVSDLGLFFKFCHGSLKPGGKLLISTPNPFGKSFNQWRTKYKLVPVNMEHVNWITPSCINELCRRYDFEFEKSIYPKPLGSKFRSLRKLLFSLWKDYRFQTRDLYYDEYTYILKKL
ncbi:methyltransferase domain-containing protein [Moorena sp. SIO4A5]|uniref:class I SAM-dependent methyltransferase n=1 Tax=Moorena sp. SIO4A5 TaxID=2607838 RepID=UPI0013C5DEA4|nr:class I SAM-dependent methyltransferase [Moorena sp. SIO4A5]